MTDLVAEKDASLSSILSEEELFRLPDSFARRHLGPGADEAQAMLATVGAESLDDLIDRTIPPSIRLSRPLNLDEGRTEAEVLSEMRELAQKNQIFRSFIGMGYYGTHTPPVILRNILESPGWYTAYTPYQAEIAQGRLEALLNFQTLILDLTGLEIANASLLDEATAAAEAMTMSHRVSKGSADTFFVSDGCHPQTIEVVQTRAWALGLQVLVGDFRNFDFQRTPVFGALVQYPTTDGAIYDYEDLVARAHAAGALVTVAADPLALVLLRSPGEIGADIAVGSTQRFGVPMGFGGPHAAYFATRDAYRRQVPGRVVGVSRDAHGKPALRLALQTREQHIRRERATSNICTAQVLLAVIAGMYAVYHGPEGLRRIARRVHRLTRVLAAGLRDLSYETGSEPFFDTLRVELQPQQQERVMAGARERGMNLRSYTDGAVGISLDETSRPADVGDLLQVFAGPDRSVPFDVEGQLAEVDDGFAPPVARSSVLLTHEVFNTYHSETELLRYLHRLESRDLSLTTSMIPLGSCTMKLNAAVEMMPITWPEFGHLHPFAPPEQTRGYEELFQSLETALAEITGFAAISLQPNAGSQGEFTGLLVIRKYHEHRGESERDVCLIPASAHGTNPASAVMAGLEVVVVACDSDGNIDLEDLAAKARDHSERLAALMVTYPSTHGVFEEGIGEICDIVHRHGGQVYMDGANLNAQVGLCRPAEFGADVCHLNLHKTFCIPHGGGGPGMGPIGVQAHLQPFLPGHSVVGLGGPDSVGAIAAAPWGSPSILPISWAYIRLMGAAGLTLASKISVLNANYIAARVASHYPVLYKGKNGFVAHECILDLRSLKRSAHIEVDDVAKRLIDFGFHAPTVSWPVAGTVMVEPTESESKQELDRFCDAMIAIREEAAQVEKGVVELEQSVLRRAPHTAEALLSEEWSAPYSREQAGFPAPWTRQYKYWPPVGRIDNPYGDRHLVCACPPLEVYTKED